jgi:hypothetical protein
MKVSWLFLSLLLLAAGAGARAAVPVPLTELTPVALEYGMRDCVYKPKTGPWVIDMGPWGQWQAAFWPSTNKIVKAYPPEFQLEGQPYKSSLTNLFAVGGELLTGVGLWSKMTCMYYWIEYQIPAGATQFTGDLYITDDVAGANIHVNASRGANQKAVVEALVDGKSVFQKAYWRQGVVPGSGAKIADIKFAIPAEATRLRFEVFSQPFDDNVNNELVIHNGQFHR